MKVMTFNLRFENERDGENAWIYRRDQVVEIIERYQPDILGTQEGRWKQLQFMQAHLPAYEIVLSGRAPDKKIQCPTIFYRTNGFDLESAEDFWLSETPHVHLSKSWDSAFPRMISAVRLRRQQSEAIIMAAVTHLDHIGIEARYQQAKMISAWAEKQSAPVVLMGDFNDDPTSRVHGVLVSFHTRLKDTWEMLSGSEYQQSYTHHGFSGVPQLARMDWILADASFQVINTQVIHDQVDGRYPSDHFPYLTEISLGDEVY